MREELASAAPPSTELTVAPASTESTVAPVSTELTVASASNELTVASASNELTVAPASTESTVAPASTELTVASASNELTDIAARRTSTASTVVTEHAAKIVAVRQNFKTYVKELVDIYCAARNLDVSSAQSNAPAIGSVGHIAQSSAVPTPVFQPSQLPTRRAATHASASPSLWQPRARVRRDPIGASVVASDDDSPIDFKPLSIASEPFTVEVNNQQAEFVAALNELLQEAAFNDLSEFDKYQSVYRVFQVAAREHAAKDKAADTLSSHLNAVFRLSVVQTSYARVKQLYAALNDNDIIAFKHLLSRCLQTFFQNDDLVAEQFSAWQNSLIEAQSVKYRTQVSIVLHQLLSEEPELSSDGMQNADHCTAVRAHLVDIYNCIGLPLIPVLNRLSILYGVIVTDVKLRTTYFDALVKFLEQDLAGLIEKAIDKYQYAQTCAAEYQREEQQLINWAMQIVPFMLNEGRYCGLVWRHSVLTQLLSFYPESVSTAQFDNMLACFAKLAASEWQQNTVKQAMIRYMYRLVTQKNNDQQMQVYNSVLHLMPDAILRDDILPALQTLLEGQVTNDEGGYFPYLLGVSRTMRLFQDWRAFLVSPKMQSHLYIDALQVRFALLFRSLAACTTAADCLKLVNLYMREFDDYQNQSLPHLSYDINALHAEFIGFLQSLNTLLHDSPVATVETIFYEAKKYLNAVPEDVTGFALIHRIMAMVDILMTVADNPFPADNIYILIEHCQSHFPTEADYVKNANIGFCPSLNEALQEMNEYCLTQLNCYHQIIELVCPDAFKVSELGDSDAHMRYYALCLLKALDHRLQSRMLDERQRSLPKPPTQLVQSVQRLFELARFIHELKVEAPSELTLADFQMVMRHDGLGILRHHEQIIDMVLKDASQAMFMHYTCYLYALAYHITDSVKQFNHQMHSTLAQFNAGLTQQVHLYHPYRHAMEFLLEQNVELTQLVARQILRAFCDAHRSPYFATLLVGSRSTVLGLSIKNLTHFAKTTLQHYQIEPTQLLPVFAWVSRLYTLYGPINNNLEEAKAVREQLRALRGVDAIKLIQTHEYFKDLPLAPLQTIDSLTIRYQGHDGHFEMNWDEFAEAVWLACINMHQPQLAESSDNDASSSYGVSIF